MLSPGSNSGETLLAVISSFSLASSASFTPRLSAMRGSSRRTVRLNWLLLTKRPENIAGFYRGREIPFNVWLGTSVESQEYAVKRIPHLLSNDCAVRFLSCEPLLGPLDLREYLGRNKINWIIVGGESGPGWRPMNPEWVRDIREQCQEAGVPFFFKQYNALHPHKLGRVLDGKEWNGVPVL